MNHSNHEQSILASVASQLCSFKEQNVLSNIRGGSKPLSSFAYTERMLTQSSFAYPERMLTQSVSDVEVVLSLFHPLLILREC